MIQNLRSVLSLLIGMAFLMLGSGALTTLISLRMGDAGFSSTTLGWIMAAYFLGVSLGPIYTHRLIAGIGHIRAFAAFGSVMSAAALAHPFWVDSWFWAVLRFVQSFCLVGMYMCTESWLNEKTENRFRGEMLAIYQVTIFLFQGGAQFLLNLPDETGFGLFILMLKREALPVDEQTDFQPVPRTSPMVSELDPRAEPESESEAEPEATTD